MQSRTATVILFFTVGLGLSVRSEALAEGLVIIVNKANPVNSIAFRDLQRIYKGERSSWGGSVRKGRITVLMRKAPAPERALVLSRIYKMSEAELMKFWMKKRLSGRSPNLPKNLSSSRLIKRAVASLPNAIGYISEKDVDKTVKVLRVDGSTVIGQIARSPSLIRAGVASKAPARRNL